MGKKFGLFLISMIVIGVVIANIPITFAGSSATISYGGSGSVTTGQEFTVDILVTGITGSNLMGAQGTVTSSDPNCVSFQKLTRVSPTNVNNNIFAYADTEGESSNFTVAKATFTAGSSACTTTINITGPKISFTDGTKLTLNTISKTITVSEPAPIQPAKSNDATLKSLTIDKGTLSPAFSSGTTSYNVEVDSSVTKVVLTATKNHANATVNATTTCNLKETGKTTCSVKVTAEDGTTTKTYSVIVSKKVVTEPDPPASGDEPSEPVPVEPTIPTKNDDATLKSLEVEGQKISPSFSSNEENYTMTVPNSVTNLTVNAIPNNSKSSVTIIGVSGLSVGVNPVKITVKAEDGTTKVYVINVTREGVASNSDSKPSTSSGNKSKSSDNFLKDIITTNGDLSPSFRSSVSSYNVIVPNEVTELDLRAILNDSKAKVDIRGNENFKVGLNVVTLEVTAEDGSLRIYTINVNRSELSGQTKLSDLSVVGQTLSPSFNPDVYEYNIDIPYNIDKLDVNAIPASPNSKVEIVGNDDLQEGNNVILVKVTDENGFVQYYRINVNKASKKGFLGLTLWQWLGILGLVLLFGLLIFLIILLLKRKKNDKEEKVEKSVIEFKPEINIGSKNGTDDDYVESGGTLNQFAGSLPESANKVIEEATVKEVPYDIYDDVVTKDELFDALQEATKNKDNSKLKLLYAQEMLNRKKEELKRKENMNREE